MVSSARLRRLDVGGTSRRWGGSIIRMRCGRGCSFDLPCRPGSKRFSWFISSIPTVKTLHVEKHMKAESMPSIPQFLLAVIPQHLLPVFSSSPALACLLIQSVADRKSSSGPRRDVASGYGRPSLIQGQKSERPWQQRIPCSGDC